MVRLHILQAIHGCRYSQQNTCSSFFMRILLLYILYAGVRFFPLRSYYNFMLVYFLSVVFFWFVRSFAMFVSFTFYVLDFFRRLFARNVYFFSETPFISRFRYRFQPKKISHFPSYMTFAIHSRSRSRHTGK